MRNFVFWLFLDNRDSLWHVKICHDAKVKICHDAKVKIRHDAKVKICHDAKVKICHDAKVVLWILKDFF